MPLIITPRQLSHRSDLYHQLGTLLGAGLPLLNSIETIGKSAPNRSFRAPLRRILADLEQGSTFAEAMRRSGQWVNSFDVALLDAGEQSGRLDSCFKLLGGFYQDRAQLARKVISQLFYPLFLLHFAVFIGPVPSLFLTGNIGSYLTQTLGVLVPIYALVFVLLIAIQGRHGETWRSWIERVFGLVPLLGSARRNLALARLSAALEALINAGVSIINAWELAAAASGSPALRRAVVAWRPRVERDGEPPSAVLRESSEFPEMFANLYHTGEVSGQLDDTLRRLNRYYQDEGTRKLEMLADLTPKLLYFFIVIVIAVRVVGFYTGYFNQINNAIGP